MLCFYDIHICFDTLGIRVQMTMQRINNIINKYIKCRRQLDIYWRLLEMLASIRDINVTYVDVTWRTATKRDVGVNKRY